MENNEKTAKRMSIEMSNEVKALLSLDFFTRVTCVILDEAEKNGNKYLISIAEILNNCINIRNREIMAGLMADDANQQEYNAGQERLEKFFEDNRDELMVALHFEKILPMFEE